MAMSDWYLLQQVWIDRLRQWFASSVLQPLVVSMDSAHTAVQAAAAPLSWTVEPGPLGVVAPGGTVDVQRRQGDDEVLTVAQP